MKKLSVAVVLVLVSTTAVGGSWKTEKTLAFYEGPGWGVGVTIMEEGQCRRTAIHMRPNLSGVMVAVLDGKLVYSPTVSQNGTMASAFVSPEVIRGMRRGTEMLVTLGSSTRKVPLRGFDRAYKKAYSACKAEEKRDE